MDENKQITKVEKKGELAKTSKERTLDMDVAMEMSKGYDRVEEIINLLSKDTRTEDIKDEYGEKIGQRSYVHPQLLNWFREARLCRADIWKMSGGEVQQEAEKRAMEAKARIILEIAKADPQMFKEAVENWKKEANFKEGEK